MGRSVSDFEGCGVCIRNRALITAILVATAPFACRSVDSLGPSGPYKPGALPDLDDAAVKLPPQDAGVQVTSNTPDAYDLQNCGGSRCSELAETILNATLGKTRNTELPMVLFYLPSTGLAKIPMLSYRQELVRVLDREAAVWAVVVVEVGEATACPSVKLRLTGTGKLRPAFSFTINDLLGTIASRTDLESTAMEAKEVDLPTQPLGKDTGRCWGQQRFTLPADATLHLTATYQRPAAQASVEAVRLEFSVPARHGGTCTAYEKKKVSFRAKALACDAHDVSCIEDAGAATCEATSVECHSAKRRVTDCQLADFTCTARDRDRLACDKVALSCKELEEVRPTLSFANGRRPLYIASIGLGTPVARFGDSGSSCWSDYGCRPTLYLFGLLHSWPLRFSGKRKWDHGWEPNPSLVFSPVVGIRILDPLFGDVAAGFRVGVSDGRGDYAACLRGLSRFGVMFGANYEFRSFAHDTLTTSTTTTNPDGSTTVRSQASKAAVPVGSRFGLILALDFAI